MLQKFVEAEAIFAQSVEQLHKKIENQELLSELNQLLTNIREKHSFIRTSLSNSTAPESKEEIVKIYQTSLPSLLQDYRDYAKYFLVTPSQTLRKLFELLKNETKPLYPLLLQPLSYPGLFQDLPISVDPELGVLLEHVTRKIQKWEPVLELELELKQCPRPLFHSKSRLILRIDVTLTPSSSKSSTRGTLVLLNDCIIFHEGPVFFWGHDLAECCALAIASIAAPTKINIIFLLQKINFVIESQNELISFQQELNRLSEKRLRSLEDEKMRKSLEELRSKTLEDQNQNFQIFIPDSKSFDSDLFNSKESKEKSSSSINTFSSSMSPMEFMMLEPSMDEIFEFWEIEKKLGRQKTGLQQSPVRPKSTAMGQFIRFGPPPSATSSTISQNNSSQNNSSQNNSLSNSQKKTMTGFMWKKGHIRRNWLRRYFVLTETALYYYEREQDRTPKGVFAITRSTTVRVMDNSKKKHGFFLTDQSRQLFLQAESENDRLAWMQTLSKKIELLNQK